MNVSLCRKLLYVMRRFITSKDFHSQTVTYLKQNYVDRNTFKNGAKRFKLKS